MVQVAVTGAGGRIGSRLVPGLDGHAVTAIDLEPVPDPGLSEFRSVELDITSDQDALRDSLEGHDVVLHLAARSASETPWADVLGPNIDGTYQLYSAAAAADVDRVIFASSNHAVHGHNMADPFETDTLVEHPRAVTPSDPVAPSGPYGISKIAGEAIGDLFARRQGLDVINFRIGAERPVDELAELQAGRPAVARYYRAMFLSPRDMRNAVRNALVAELPENPLTVNLTSRNAERYLSLTKTMRALDYRPQDDSAEILGD